MRKSNVTDDELGKTAWDAYSASVGGKAFNGDPLPAWDVMCKDEKKTQLVTAWKRAGRAVASLVERKMPAPPSFQPYAAVSAPSGRVPSSGPAISSMPPPTRTLAKRTLCCGSFSLALQTGCYACPCGDHKENI